MLMYRSSAGFKLEVSAGVPCVGFLVAAVGFLPTGGGFLPTGGGDLLAAIGGGVRVASPVVAGDWDLVTGFGTGGRATSLDGDEYNEGSLIAFRPFI